VFLLNALMIKEATPLRKISGPETGYPEAESSCRGRKSMMDYAGSGLEPVPAEKVTRGLRNYCENLGGRSFRKGIRNEINAGLDTSWKPESSGRDN
jgi:hypothetical protein